MRKFTMKPTAMYIICAVIFAVCAAAVYLAWRYLAPLKILMYVLVGIFIALAFLFGFFLVPAFFRRTVICLSADEITLYTGMIFLRREQMKLSSKQYITRISMPFARFSGFNFLVIRALGGNMFLMFLDVKDCDEIERQLEGRGE